MILELAFPVYGDAPLPADHARTSIERDIARIDVREKDTELAKCVLDEHHVPPLVAKLVLFGGRPFGHHFERIIRRFVEPGTSEVEHKRTRHNGHFDDLQFVVKVDELGDVVSADFNHLVLVESQINIPLAEVAVFAIKDFDRSALWTGLESSSKTSLSLARIF